MNDQDTDRNGSGDQRPPPGVVSHLGAAPREGAASAAAEPVGQGAKQQVGEDQNADEEAPALSVVAPPPSAVPSPSTMASGVSSPTSPAAEAIAPPPSWPGAHAQDAAGSSIAAPTPTVAPAVPVAHAQGAANPAATSGAFNYDDYPELPANPMDEKNFRNAAALRKFKRALGTAQKQLEGVVNESPIHMVVLATKRSSSFIKWTPLDTIEEAAHIYSTDPTPRTLEDANGVVLRLMYDQHQKFEKVI